MSASTSRRDRGMVLVVFLLGVLYVAFVAVLIAVRTSVVAVILIAGTLLFVQYWFADRIALASMRAREVDEHDAPVLHGIVDRLCATADMAKPRVAVADTDLPNAFATGRTSRRAVLCVTTGLTRRLSPDELEGVLAHELSHIAHRDVAVMTAAAFLGVLAGLVTRFGFYGGVAGGRGRRGRDGDQAALMMMVVVLVSALVYVLSFLLVRALSRYRELAADRSGAILTGHPSALAAALTKVTDDTARIPTRDLRAAQPVSALLFAPALGPGMHLSTLLSTHPSLQCRLDQLGELARELGEEAPSR